MARKVNQLLFIPDKKLISILLRIFNNTSFLLAAFLIISL